MNTFEPIHAAHAIEQVGFLVEFSNPVADAVIPELKALSGQFAEELPGLTDTQAVKFVFGMNVSSNPQAAQISGFSRRSINRDGSLDCELRVDKNVIQFVTTKYTRWVNLWDQVSRYLNVLLPVYSKYAGLSSVGLNYVDKFYWNGNVSDCNARALLQQDSKFICRHVFETNQLWHSHTGIFIEADNNTKRLLNLNLDSLDEPRTGINSRVVAISTTLTDQFNQIGYEPLNAIDDINAFVSTHMKSMHDFGKQILSDVLTKDMSVRIALTDQLP